MNLRITWFRSAMENWSAFGGLLIAILATGMGVQHASAEIPVERFLARLQEERLHGLASDYLDYLKSKDLLPEQLKKDFALARLEIKQNELSNITSVQKRDARVAELQEGFKGFLNEQKSHPRRGEVRVKLADLYVQQGQSSLDAANKTTDAPEKQRLQSIARTAFQESEKLFEEGVKEIAGELDKILGAKIDAADVKAVERRDLLKGEYRKSQIMVGMARKLVAETFPADSKEQTDWYNKAESQFNEVSSKASRTTEAGPYLLSVLYRGQVQAALKKTAEATDSLSRVADQSDGGIFRILRVQATVALVRLFSQPPESKFELAIDRGQALLKDQQPSEKDSVDWQELQLAVLEAKKAWADSMKSDSKNDAKVRKINSEIRPELQKLSRQQNASGEKARKILSDLGVEVDAPADLQMPKVRTFADAFKAANERLDRAQQDKLTVQIIEGQIAQSPSSDELKKQLERLNAGTASLRNQAIQLYQKSLQLFNLATDTRQDLSAARFRLSYMLYIEGRYNDAAVVGDLAARTNRGTPEGLSAAQIAIASYQQLINTSTSSESKPVQALEQFAAFVLDVWPDEEASEAAAAALLKSALEDRRWDDAVKVLSFLKSEAKKSEVQRDLGFVFYNQFLLAYENAKKAKTELNAPEILSLRDKSQQLLSEGLQVLKPDTLNERAVEAGYALADIHLRKDEIAQALDVLNRPEVGPLAVVESNKISLKPKVRLDALRAGLQASVSQSISGGQALDSARVESLVGQMQKVASENPEDKTLLTNALIVLANELKAKLADKKSIDEKQKLGVSLQVLLSQLIDVSQEANVLEWSAGTLGELGKTTGETPGLQALSSGLKATSEKGFIKLAELVRKDPSVLQGSSRKPEDVQQLLAKAYLANGRHAEAEQIYKQILAANNMMLMAQMDAAMNYQLWAQDKDAEKLRFALYGNAPDPAKGGKNSIWGWGQISQLLAKSMGKQESLRPFFFDARYQLAVCRSKQAALETDSAKQTKLYEQALADVRSTYINYPDLGGEVMMKQFDGLARAIQAALKQEVNGLESFK